MKAGLTYLHQQEKALDKDGDKSLTQEEATKVASTTKKKFAVFTSITPREVGGKWVYDWKGSSDTEKSNFNSEGGSNAELTKIHYSGGNVAYADPLTSNRKLGSKPSNIPGWKHAQLLNKSQDIWRRGHMVSQAFGGDGKIENLSIISQSTNSKMDKGPEKYAKEQTSPEKGKTLIYRTTWENHPADGNIVNFAKSITVEVTDKNGELPKKVFPFNDLPPPSKDLDNVVLHLNELGEGMISQHYGVDLLFARELILAKGTGRFDNITEVTEGMTIYYKTKGYSDESDKMKKMIKQIKLLRKNMKNSKDKLQLLIIMKENYISVLEQLKANDHIELLVEYSVDYRELQPMTLQLDVEELEDEGWGISKDQQTYLNLSGISIGWESTLKGVDMTLTGGFTLNSLTDALTMSSTFWKGAFSISEGDPVPENLKEFSFLGWFSRQPWDDGRRGCFIKQPGNFPPPIAFYSRGWFVKLDMTFEAYLENMFKMYGAKGWQFFFIDPTADMTYKEDILEDMRVITEQFPLLFPENDWEFLNEKYEMYKLKFK